jgi:hypothetical protein
MEQEFPDQNHFEAKFMLLPGFVCSLLPTKWFLWEQFTA